MSTRPGTTDEENKDDDNEENKDDDDEVKRPSTTRDIDTSGVDMIESLDAVVQIKIPKVPKELELDDDGNEIPDETPESDLDDIPFEDKCLQVNSNSET